MKGITEMFMRQRNIAEEERDGWKEGAMQSEQQLQSLRDLLIIAEGQRDQAKIDAEHWKGEWAVVMGQLGGATAEVEAMRKDAARLDFLANEPVFDGFADSPLDVYELESIVAEQNGRVDPNVSDRREAFRRVIDAALAVQPTTTTGETHE